jgi:hypothetical protein
VLAIGCWRQDRRKSAIVLAALAQITHAPVLLPLMAILVLGWSRFEPDRRALVRGWLISLVAALPAAYLVFASPVTSQTSAIWSLWVEIETVALRALVLIVPFALLYLQRHGFKPKAPVIAAGVLVIGQLVTVPISGMGTGWNALSRRPDPTANAIPRSPVFVAGATYRVLTYGDGKYGQYAVVRAGGRLDSEFFPESLARRSFRDEATYARFLTARQVDYVVVDHRYRKFRTNEEQLLTAMSTPPSDTVCVGGLRVARVDETSTFAVYRVTRDCFASTATN